MERRWKKKQCERKTQRKFLAHHAIVVACDRTTGAIDFLIHGRHIDATHRINFCLNFHQVSPFSQRIYWLIVLFSSNWSMSSKMQQSCDRNGKDRSLRAVKAKWSKQMRAHNNVDIAPISAHFTFQYFSQTHTNIKSKINIDLASIKRVKHSDYIHNDVVVDT